MLNRAALIVRPKQLFLDWAAGLDDSGLVPEVAGEQTVYLVPEFESDEEGRQVLKHIYPEIFEQELDGWHTDQSAWPQNRDLKTFQEWFRGFRHELQIVAEGFQMHLDRRHGDDRAYLDEQFRETRALIQLS